jgi:elongation factor G
MKSYQSKHIKNVALFGHQGSGKTTMAETMLFEAGSISRRGSVEDQNTTSDYNSIEQERGNSLFSTLMNLEWKDTKINIIDTPGFDDFVGEVTSTLKVIDTGLMIINAQYGLEVGTEIIWQHARAQNKPMLFAINQLDADKADYDQCIDELKTRYGNRIVVMQFPVNQGVGFDGIIDVLRMTYYKFGADGGKPEKLPIPEEHQARADELHNALVEAAAENDEGLMELYFEKGSLDEEELQNGLQIGMKKAEICPVFCLSAKRNMGSGRIMGFIHDVCPSAAEMPAAPLAGGGTIPIDADGETVLFVFKTISEQHLGDMSFFKVYSGKVSSGTDLVNVGSGNAERLNQLFTVNGKNREQVDELVAGDIGATVKLKSTHTNDTLAPKGSQNRITDIEFPSSRIREAIVSQNKGDEDKLAAGLNALHQEDPTYVIEHSQELRQTIIHGQGELHLGILKHKLAERFKVKVDFEKPRIPYRETIQKGSSEVYRHKKQSGGSGQFAEVHMLVEPYYEGMPAPANMNVRNTEEITLPWGGKLIYNWCIVGGSIDAKFSTAILKGIMEKMEDGPLTGSYVRDVRISVYDGKMHPVDSNDTAFKIAGRMAFRAAFKNADPKILEPVYDVEIKVPSDMSGDVMSDLQTRRAQIQGMDTDGRYQVIKAKAPLAELYKYSSALRSVTQGRAKHTRNYAEYASVPFDIQQKLINDHAEVLEEA